MRRYSSNKHNKNNILLKTERNVESMLKGLRIKFYLSLIIIIKGVLV